MDAQRRATSGKPSIASATKKRGLGSDAPGSSARGSEDRSSVAPPPPPRGTKRAREIEGIDKVCYSIAIFLVFFIFCSSAVLCFFLLPYWGIFDCVLVHVHASLHSVRPMQYHPFPQTPVL